jgi:hypothetical protein
MKFNQKNQVKIKIQMMKTLKRKPKEVVKKRHSKTTKISTILTYFYIEFMKIKFKIYFSGD